MAVHDNEGSDQEFEQLFAAYTNADLIREERDRLYELAGQDVARRGAVAEVEAVHELFGVEVAMRIDVMQPVEPVEEADESYRRLARAAARAEDKLRANLCHPTVTHPKVTHPKVNHPVESASAGRPSRVWLVVGSLAALILIAVAIGWFLKGDSQAPALDPSIPEQKVLGAVIDVTTTITAASPELSWSEVRGAASYEATIEDATGGIVLRRAAGRRFTNWILSDADLSLLRDHLSEHSGDLYIAVVARDEASATVGRTGARARLTVR